MSTTRNYSSIYNIKDFARNHLMPKYFDVKEVNDFNVGLLGMTTELISSGFEDTFKSSLTVLPSYLFFFLAS